MTQSISPKLADTVQYIKDEHKKELLLKLISALFEKSIDTISLSNKNGTQRVILSLKAHFEINHATIPQTIQFIVKSEGILEFYNEFASPLFCGNFCNVVTVEGPNYHFIKNGVTFDFTPPLETTISSAVLLHSLHQQTLD